MSVNDHSASEDDALSDTESSGDSSDSDIDDVVADPTWARLTNGLRQIPFTGNTGLSVNIPGNNTPIDWFLLLLDDIFLEGICRETNKYALKVFCEPNTTEHSRVTKWKDITVAELKTYWAAITHGHY